MPINNKMRIITRKNHLTGEYCPSVGKQIVYLSYMPGCAEAAEIAAEAIVCMFDCAAALRENTAEIEVDFRQAPVSAVVLIVTRNFSADGICAKEVEFARNKGITVIPIVYDGNQEDILIAQRLCDCKVRCVPMDSYLFQIDLRIILGDILGRKEKSGAGTELWEQGHTQWLEGNYKQAVAIWNTAAVNGDVDCCEALALNYANDRHDFDKATELFETAFRLREPDAFEYYTLAELYEQTGNCEKSQICYGHSAKLGNSAAYLKYKPIEIPPLDEARQANLQYIEEGNSNLSFDFHKLSAENQEYARKYSDTPNDNFDNMFFDFDPDQSFSPWREPPTNQPPEENQNSTFLTPSTDIGTEAQLEKKLFSGVRKRYRSRWPIATLLLILLIFAALAVLKYLGYLPFLENLPF